MSMVHPIGIFQSLYKMKVPSNMILKRKKNLNDLKGLPIIIRLQKLQGHHKDHPN